MFAVVASVFLAASVLSGSAAATPPAGEVVRTDLAKGTTNAPISIVTHGEQTEVLIQGLLLKPGALSGWHSHPGPEYSVVTKGAVHLQTAASCPAAVLGAGQAIFIPAGLPHAVANVGIDDAEVVVTYTVPADQEVRADAPAVCQ